MDPLISSEVWCTVFYNYLFWEWNYLYPIRGNSSPPRTGVKIKLEIKVKNVVKMYSRQLIMWLIDVFVLQLFVFVFSMFLTLHHRKNFWKTERPQDMLLCVIRDVTYYHKQRQESVRKNKDKEWNCGKNLQKPLNRGFLVSCLYLPPVISPFWTNSR